MQQGQFSRGNPGHFWVEINKLAERFGYAGPNDAFRNFCRELGIRPARRNPHYFDTKHVRLRPDATQNIPSATNLPQQEVDLVAQRRARRATQ